MSDMVFTLFKRKEKNMLKEIKKGFTLAEVLIVIGIIGVVAALTLPNLNHATGDKEKVTKVKKIYSNLTEAVDRAQAIYGPFDTWFNDLKDSEGYIDDSATASERFAKRVTEFMKVSKDCGFNEGCFSSEPLLFDGTEQEDCDNYLECFQSRRFYMVGVSDGMSIAFERDGYIRVDIDGPNKGKNQEGVDIFNFTIGLAGDTNGKQVNQLYPSNSPNNWTGNFLDCSQYGKYETAWVIENGNLDYLKCPDELNWETKTSCE